MLSTGLAINPSELSRRLALAESQLAVRYSAGAEATLVAGLEWYQDDPQLRLMLGQIRIKNRATDAVIGDLTAAARLPMLTAGEIDESATRQVNARASFTLAILAKRRGDKIALVEHLSACLESNPNHSVARLMAAEIAVEQERPADATSHLVRLLSLPPDEQPTENEVLRSLPFPAGLQVWATALAQSDQRDAARAIL